VLERDPYEGLSRRTLLCAAFTGFTTLPIFGQAGGGKRLKVVVAGAHPDDPETGAGGTMARYSALGHNVVSLYLTRGEAGIRGSSHKQAAEIRTTEAEEACRILGARAVFAGQVDGAAEVNSARYGEFYKVLAGLAPNIVLTHFPVDTHRDHRAASMLTFDCWQRSGRKFALYFFEVLTGDQTQNFHPTSYVDITGTEVLKRKACYAHKSQGPAEFYPEHEAMSLFRGRECGVKYAEAFVGAKQNGSTSSRLPGL
jgi:LmbE family N-acetylglucosaminyl deacetylase